MSSVADQLREARESKKLTVYQVAEATKIRTDHVRALDSGNYDVFSAPVYIKGFVRSYATYLKLDVPQVMTALEQELSQSDKHRAHPPLTERPRTFIDVVMYQLSKLNWRIVLPIVIAGVLLLSAVSIYRVWRNHKAQNPLSNLGPGVYQAPKGREAGDLLPLPATNRH